MKNKPIIFYADDDNDDIVLFKEAGENLGAQVEVFPLGEAMLDAMFNPPPQATIVFIDLNMPVKSGFEIIKEIKASPFFNDIPVIVLSTACDPKTVNRARNIGADYFINKPTTYNGLRKSIEHVLSIDWKSFKQEHATFLHKH
ncbi:MAG TPA: response regulator [Flavobacterium sp.]|jgi:CheY-like chemotaxis protein